MFAVVAEIGQCRIQGDGLLKGPMDVATFGGFVMSLLTVVYRNHG